MSRPRSSNGYSRPKSNSSHVGEGAADNRSNAVVTSSRAKSSDKPKRQIVGQYMIGKTIGEGTFGKVKLAVHIPTGEKVAIKILEKSRIKEQADVRRVNREIKILKKSRHGNIIQLYEVLDTKNTIYLIMECCEGGEMFDYIVAQKRVAEPQACKFFHQIIDGIEVLHKNEITHRDLKPENLLLKMTADGWVVKIVDFGLSNTHEGGRLLVTACGSPCYAAPEMIAGKKYFGPLADLWSVGVILFALVSGYLPFEDPNTSVLYKKILSGDYTCPRWVSPEVKDLIHCILEVDPRKRYTVDNIRRHPWYTAVPESAIPRDTQVTTEASRNEILTSMAKAGMDPQAVLDGVASQAFNGLTAMYYLLEQKLHTRMMRNAEQQKAQIRQNSSNLSKPETGSDNNDTQRKEPSPQPQVMVPVVGAGSGAAAASAVVGVHAAAGAAPSSAPATSSGHYGHAPKAPAPLKLMNIDPLAPIVTHHQAEKPAKDYADVPIKTYVPTTPYLQTPAILQQQAQGQRNAHQRQYHGNMPSLDMYLKGGVDLPVTSSQNDTSEHSHPVNAKAGPSNRGVVVPPLNLRGKNLSNATSATVAAATGNSLFGAKLATGPALTSQTARGPSGGVVTQPGDEVGGSGSAAPQHPHSARGPLPTDIPIEIPERPNTRRSRLRSRGDPTSADQSAAQSLPPAMDLGGMDAIPPNKDTSPQMPVRRKVPTATGAAASGGDGGGPVDSAAAAMSLLVISQKKSLSSKEGSGAGAGVVVGATATGTAPLEAQVPLQPQGVVIPAPASESAIAQPGVAPEAPKSAAPSSANAVGGRRGRNLTGPTTGSGTGAGGGDSSGATVQPPSRLTPVAPPAGRPSAPRPV